MLILSGFESAPVLLVQEGTEEGDEPNQKRSSESKDRATALAQKIVSQYGQGDWALRAQRLIFYVQQGIAMYGNASY